MLCLIAMWEDPTPVNGLAPPYRKAIKLLDMEEIVVTDFLIYQNQNQNFKHLSEHGC